jgi:hypothetical protein
MARTCYLCGGGNFVRRTGIVRDNQALNVLECTSCGLVFLSSFEHIKNGFYEESGMHAQAIDVQTWLRQTAIDDDRRFNQFRRRIENMSVLDSISAAAPAVS